MSRSHNTCEMGGAQSLFPCFAFPSVSSVRGTVGRPTAQGCDRACLCFHISQSSALLHNTACRHERASGHSLRAGTRVQHPSSVGIPVYSLCAARGEGKAALPMFSDAVYVWGGQAVVATAQNLSHHEYPGGKASQTLNLQFESSSLPSLSEACCTQDRAGFRKAQHGCYAVQYSLVLAKGPG